MTIRLIPGFRSDCIVGARASGNENFAELHQQKQLDGLNKQTGDV